MEEAAAGEAGGIRRPARASRRRGTARRAPEEAADDDAPPVAGEGGNNRPAAADSRDGDLAAEEDDDDEEEEPDDKYLDRTWESQMSLSIFLMWAKAQPLTRPPAWLTAAREAGAAAGEEQLGAAGLYEALCVLPVVQEAALAVHLCLYKLGVVSAGRTMEAMKQNVAVGLLASVATALASALGAAGDSSDRGWREVASAVLLPLMPAVSAVFSFLLGELMEQVGELFRR